MKQKQNMAALSGQEQRLAEAPVGKLLFSLAVPTVLAQLVNLLYNIIDRMYVGRIPEAGTKALAGLGVAFPIIMLISAFAALIGSGGAPRAAIKMGQKDHEGAEEILGNSFTALLVLAVLLTVIFLPTKDGLLMLFGSSQDTLPYASNYLGIYLIGTIFVQMTLGLNQFIAAQGFSKISMMTVVIGAVINIVLDPIFIFVFKMGVSGAALATILSQGVSAVWVLRFLTGKKTILHIRRKHLKLKWPVLVSITALGVSPFIMNATECLVQLTFNSGMQKYGNDLYVSAMAILFSINQLVWLPLSGVGQGAQPIISFNYGAGNMHRVRKTFRLTFAFNLTFSIVFVGIILLFPRIFIGLFTDDKQLLELGSYGLRIFMAGMCVMGAQNACQQTFLATGNAKISLFMAMLRKVILMIPLALVLPMFINPPTNGLYLAEAFSDVLAATITTVVFFSTTYRRLRKADIAQQT